jgi:hypothetical protein
VAVNDEELNPELYEQQCAPRGGCDDPFIRHFIIGMWVFAAVFCVSFIIACLMAGRVIR